jgi:cytochrome c biogenesis protein
MIRLLGSTKLTIALCLLLAAGGIAGSLLYQGNTAFGKPSTFNVFRSPLFLIPAGLLVLNVLFCVIHRLREMPAAKPRTWSFAGLHLGLLLLAAGLAVDGVSGFVGTQYFPVGVPYAGYHNWRTGRDETLPFSVTVTGSEVRFHPRNLQVGVKDAAGKKVGLFVVREGVPFDAPGTGLVVTPRKFDEERKTLVLDASVGGARQTGVTATAEAPARVGGYAIVPVSYFNPEPSDYVASVRFTVPGRVPEEATLRINHPASFAGISFNIVDLNRDAYGNAIVGLQVTREPGAPLFWVGALLFGMSLVTHLLLKNAARGAALTPSVTPL